jgi:hypothetical protein
MKPQGPIVAFTKDFGIAILAVGSAALLGFVIYKSLNPVERIPAPVTGARTTPAAELSETQETAPAVVQIKKPKVVAVIEAAPITAVETAPVAATPAVAAQSVATISEAVTSKRLGLEVSFTGTSNLAPIDDVEHSGEVGLELLSTYRIDEMFTALLSLGGSQSLSGERELSADDGLAQISLKNRKLVGPLQAGISFKALIPLSKDARIKSLLTNLTIAPRLSLDLKSLGVSGASITYSLGLSRALHTYRTTALGGSNRPYSLSQTVSLSYSPIEPLSIDVVFQHANSWTYAGQLRQTFLSYQEASWSLTDFLALSLGHRNGGDVLKPNGESWNIALFNDRSSVVYGSVVYTY